MESSKEIDSGTNGETSEQLETAMEIDDEHVSNNLDQDNSIMDDNGDGSSEKLDEGNREEMTENGVDATETVVNDEQPATTKADLDNIFGEDDSDEDLVVVSRNRSKSTAKESDLDDLLGDSDEEGKVAEGEPTVDSSRRKELDDLLGASDDEYEEDEAVKEVSLEADIAVDKPEEGGLSDLLDEMDGKEPTEKVEEPKVEASTLHLAISEATMISENKVNNFVRIPNFVKIQPREFSDDYDPSAEEELFAEATAVIRWRYKVDSDGEVIKDDNGNPVMESNAKLVRWDDGTCQLIIGTAVFNTKTASSERW